MAIHIKPENKGKFTKKAKAAGMGVQEYASKVMANKDNYPSSTVKQANFAKNAAQWKNEGGPLTDLNDPTNRDTVPAMLTPGEFVMNKEAAALFGPHIEAMNKIGLQQRHAENVQHLNWGGWLQKLLPGAAAAGNDPTLIPRINETVNAVAPYLAKYEPSYPDAILRNNYVPPPVEKPVEVTDKDYKGIADSISLEGEEDIDKVVPPVKDETPWYTPLLGHKSKTALGLPLNENEQRLQQEAGKFDSAINPSLVGDDPVGEGYADYTEGDIPTDIDTHDAEMSEIVDNFTEAENKEFNTLLQQSGAGPKETKAILDQGKSLFKDMFGDWNKKDLGRFLMLYLGGRLTGGSHMGSLKYAGASTLQFHDARLKAEAELAAKQQVKRKSGTKTLEDSTGRKYKFFEYEGPGGTSWRTYFTDSKGKQHLLTEEALTSRGVNFNKEGAAKSRSEAWGKTHASWKGTFKDIFDSENPKEGFEGDKYNLITGAEAANDTREYFKDQGYDIQDSEQLAAMQVISNRAARRAAQYAAENPKKKVGSLRPFLQQETLFAKTGASDVWVAEDSDNVNKIKYTNPKKVAKLDTAMKRIITNENPNLDPTSVNRTAKDQWNRLRLAWDTMSDKYKGNNFSPSKDESGFYVFALKVLEDSKITEEELKGK